MKPLYSLRPRDKTWVPAKRRCGNAEALLKDFQQDSNDPKETLRPPKPKRLQNDVEQEGLIPESELSLTGIKSFSLESVKIHNLDIPSIPTPKIHGLVFTVDETKLRMDP